MPERGSSRDIRLSKQAAFTKAQGPPPAIFQANQPMMAYLKPFKTSRCIKASFHISENTIYSPTTKGFRREISMKLVYQYMAIFFNFSPTSNHLHPLQVENCDSNSRLVVDEDDYGKFKLERVRSTLEFCV